MSILIRWACAFILVAATYNPTGFDYTRWASVNYQTQLPLTVLLGVVLMIAYVIFVRATLRSIGPFGVLLILALIGALIWVFEDLGLLSMQTRALSHWVSILSLSLILGVGLSWSIMRRKISGQVDMDDVDE